MRPVTTLMLKNNVWHILIAVLQNILLNILYIYISGNLDIFLHFVLYTETRALLLAFIIHVSLKQEVFAHTTLLTAICPVTDLWQLFQTHTIHVWEPPLSPTCTQTRSVRPQEWVPPNRTSSRFLSCDPAWTRCPDRSCGHRTPTERQWSQGQLRWRW